MIPVEHPEGFVGFPKIRMRRLRRTASMRDMVRETTLTLHDLIYPLFVVPGEGVREEIPSMPDQYRYSIDTLVEEVRKIYEEGIRSVILFGIPESKDEQGTDAFDENGIIQKALRALKEALPDMVYIADLCMCEYTSHGHCGILKNGTVDNDTTLQFYGRIAVAQARAGADIIAPSGMMDGQVRAIRQSLDEAGFEHIPIMAYSAKYASSFYGPFRDAADSAPQFGNRKDYQMDPGNAREALLEVDLDILEGADIVMVKPALSYMDIIWRVKQRVLRPVAVYNVSGEYSMVKAASARGWIHEESIVFEILHSLKRAGADLILTYHARDVARWLARR